MNVVVFVISAGVSLNARMVIPAARQTVPMVIKMRAKGRLLLPISASIESHLAAITQSNNVRSDTAAPLDHRPATNSSAAMSGNIQEKM